MPLSTASIIRWRLPPEPARLSGVTGTAAQQTSVDIGGLVVPVTLRRNTRAKRVILRIEPGRAGCEDGVVVTLPRGASSQDGLDWLQAKADWVRAQLASLAPVVPFSPGCAIPVLGVDHVIRHHPERRGRVWIEAGEIFVSGRSEHTARRVRDWLRRQAKQEIGGRARDKAARLERPIGRLGFRDTRSRWGSCAPGGHLNFCWRLIMAPEFVLDYVVAHEVAHLREANHGAEFWRLVGTLTEEVERARRWLRKHGETLHRFG